MIKNFSQYLVEEEREVYFTFGRMNPPTIGHGKVMDTLASKSGKADYKVYVSQSQNAKKDPLNYSQKVKHIRKMFPKHARQVMMDKKVRNVFDVAASLYDQGYRNINMVVGADRITEFKTLLNKYNGVKARHGFYNFKRINIISAGARDPDAEGVEGMSASKQRANATANDFVSFSQGVPKTMSNKDARSLFNDVRKGMGLKEERSFKNHVELTPVSETREQYVQGNLYQVGDSVVIKETEELGTVSFLGSNYVIVECGDKKYRKWLDAVELVEGGSGKKQDPDIKDREGTQPARYHKGLKKSTKTKRDAHFKKHGKKADDDASAYKPAPGDATAKTKPSKYTKAFKDMYDEDCWDGYKEVGMKKKGNKMVPNCVPENAGEEGTDKLVKKYKKDTPISEDVTAKQLVDLEKFADRILKKFNVDIEFTRHFGDRMNDKRNDPPIKVQELQRVFKKIARNKAKNIRQNPDSEAVIKDLQTDLNLPVVINYDRKNDEFEVINKTIMRKKDFRTTSKTITTEDINEAINESISIPMSLATKIPGLKQKAYQKAVRWYLDWRRKNPKQGAVGIQRAAGATGVDGKELQRILHKLIDKGKLPKHLATNPAMLKKEDAVATAKASIDKEKESDKAKHDRMLDRARLAATKKKNRETK